MATTAGIHLLKSVFNKAEYAALPVLFMLCFDGLFALFFYITVSQTVESIKMFKLGISASFMLGTFIRVMYLAYTEMQREA